METETVPLLDVSVRDANIVERVREEVLNTGRFIGGDPIPEFEAGWTAQVEAGETVATSSGTMALTLLLQALRYRSGLPLEQNRVIVPTTSFVATRDAVLHAGFRPLYVDVDETGLMDLGDLEGAAHRDVAAIIPVHLYGQTVDIERVEEIAKHFNIPWVIEDACQAHGARYSTTGEPVGSRNPTAWSFMPAKILGTWGDAGAITLPERYDDIMAFESFLRAARNHGRTQHSHHEFAGWKGRMDTLKAVVLREKLKNLDTVNFNRRKRAEAYNASFADILCIRTQPETHGRVWSYYVIWLETAEMRDALQSYLSHRNIETGKHYPYVLCDEPQSNRLAATCLTLPLWPRMSSAQQGRVVNAVRGFFGA